MKLLGYALVLAAAFILVAGYALVGKQRDLEALDWIVMLLAFVPGVVLLRLAARREREARRRL